MLEPERRTPNCPILTKATENQGVWVRCRPLNANRLPKRQFRKFVGRQVPSAFPATGLDKGSGAKLQTSAKLSPESFRL